MARGFSLFEETLLVFEAQDRNIEWYTKVAAAVQKQSSATVSSMTRKEELLPRHHWIAFPRGEIELNPARNQNLCHQHQAWVKLQLALRLLLPTILQLYHLPPPLPPPVSSSSYLFTRCQPLCASCCTALLYFSRDYTVRLKMFSLFFVFVFYV